MKERANIEMNEIINQPSFSGSNRGPDQGQQNPTQTRIDWAFWGTLLTLPWSMMTSCSNWASNGTPRLRTFKFMSVSMTSGAGGSAGVYEIMDYHSTPEGAAKETHALSSIVSILDQIAINWTTHHRGHPDSHQLLCPPCPPFFMLLNVSLFAAKYVKETVNISNI